MLNSSSYGLVCEHYRALLSHHYTWTFGGSAGKIKVNFNLLSSLLKAGKLALDLGSGSGFQTIPLMQLGYHVTAIDASETLLQELTSEANARSLNELTVVCGDLLSFEIHVTQELDVIVCMGDTLTHLASLEEVNWLLHSVYTHLKPGGTFIVQFRDLTQPLVGTDRFIPVRSDERTVFTCFLEWMSPGTEPDGSGTHIHVHDLVHVKKGIGAWELCKSWYRKLGLSGEYVRRQATDVGFTCRVFEVDTGMCLLVLDKDLSS